MNRSGAHRLKHTPCQNDLRVTPRKCIGTEIPNGTGQVGHHGSRRVIFSGLCTTS
jgi:hypothetical protein